MFLSNGWPTRCINFISSWDNCWISDLKECSYVRFHYSSLGRRSTKHCSKPCRLKKITHNTITNIDAKGISKRVTDIEKMCLLYVLKEVIIFSKFIKRQFTLMKTIRQVNYHLRDECRSNKFHFISNDNITSKYLWKDGLHLLAVSLTF